MLVPMLVPMLMPGRRWPGPTALLAVAASMSEAAAAVRAGADLVDLVDLGDLGGTERPAVAEFRARHPGVLVCAPDEAADLVRHPAVAMATGALLVCADPGAARASALPPARLIVEVRPDGVAAAAEAGWAALVDVDRAAELAELERQALADVDRAAELAELERQALAEVDRAELAAGPGRDDPAALAGIVALAALSSWLGAAVVRTRHPPQVRRALDMAAVIKGTRLPARTVRGLA